MLKITAKKIFKALPGSFQNDLRYYVNNRRKQSILEAWEKSGRPLPPPHQFKQTVIEQYQSLSGYNVLVETGTFLGDMVEAQRKKFNRIFSIELDEKLWKDAVERFRKYKHIIIIKGDSGKVLTQITSELKEPAVFWLDGHYSAGITAKGEKECPIYGEIDAIFKYNKLEHILLVDDARCFNGQGDYPTIDELTHYIQSKDRGYKVEVKDDIIRYTK